MDNYCILEGAQSGFGCPSSRKFHLVSLFSEDSNPPTNPHHFSVPLSSPLCPAPVSVFLTESLDQPEACHFLPPPPNLPHTLGGAGLPASASS